MGETGSWGQPRGPSEEMVRRAARERAALALATVAETVVDEPTETNVAALDAAVTHFRSYA